MALIGKIREQSTLLMIVIGVGMILFIVPYDSIMKMFSGAQTGDSIGTFDGEPMYSKEWGYEFQVNRLKAQYFNAQREISDEDARNGIFNAKNSSHQGAFIQSMDMGITSWGFVFRINVQGLAQRSGE